MSSADSKAAAELMAMIKEQAAALVKEMSKKKSFKRRCARNDEESDDNDDNDDNDENDENDDANDDTNANANDNDNRNNKDGDTRKDDGPYAWIGKWVPKPKGEHCRRSSTTKKGHTRKGFTTKTLLEKARITEDKYRMYKVCFQFVISLSQGVHCHDIQPLAGPGPASNQFLSHFTLYFISAFIYIPMYTIARSLVFGST